MAEPVTAARRFAAELAGDLRARGAAAPLPEGFMAQVRAILEERLVGPAAMEPPAKTITITSPDSRGRKIRVTIEEIDENA
jgi:hypothetical protein